MQTISPEDRMSLIVRQQDDWRRQAAFDRTAASGWSERTRSGVGSPEHRRLNIRQWLQHLLHALVRNHLPARHGAAH